MTQDTKAPERVWILRDVLGGVHVFDERGDAPEDTRDDVEYVRADLLTAAEDRAESAEAERDADRKLLAECEDWIERADKARLDVIAERDRLAAVLKTMTARAEVASRYQDDRFNFGWMIKEAHATLAKMEKTDDHTD